MDDRTLPIPKVTSVIGREKARERATWSANSFASGLFQQTGECVFVIDMDLHYIAANRRALQLLGYNEDELIGISVSEVMSMEALADKQAPESESGTIYERILKRKDGALIPVEISASVVSDESGAPVYIQSIVRDISERKRTEKLLKRSGRILSVIGEATARLFQSSDIQSRISEMLESLGRALEIDCCVIFEADQFAGIPQMRIKYSWSADPVLLDVEHIVSPHLADVIAVPDRPYSAPAATPAFVTLPISGSRGSWTFLGLFDKENALAWLPADLSSLQTAANLIAAALQRIRYEDTIRLNESRNRAIVDTLPDLLMRISSSGTILDFSARPDHPLYIQRDLIAGKMLDDTWPESVVSRIVGEENRGSFTTPRWVESFKFPFSNGVYEARLQPINPNEALIIIRDISDMIQLNEMKTDFINRASHELRTPLTAAMLMVDLIEMGGPQEELDEYWLMLRNELNRQKTLIDRLLMAGRLESGMVKLEASPMDLLPVLAESMRAVKPIADNKKVALSMSAPDRSLMVLGDAGALEQVFINLINNATKFSPQGKSVDVIARRGADFAEISIVDHGMGIATDAIPHLFEKFYRAKNVTIAEIPGSGIGLYIVKSIIEELGGEISVSSVLQEGTTFTVSLRVAS